MNKGQKTKNNILKTSKKLFSAFGYNGTSTRMISEAADISEATIFKYFKKKEDLLISVLNHILEPMENYSKITLSNLLNQEKAIEEILTDVLKERYEFFSNHKDDIKILLHEVTVNKHAKILFKDLLFRDIFETLSPFFDKRKSLNEIDDIDNMTLTNSFFSILIIPIIFQIFYIDNQIDYKLQINIFLNGIKKGK